MSDSQGFNQLHEGVQRWIWQQKWDDLRDIQESAIKPILDANCDVIISASTAAGKTEAAFLPACSHIATHAPSGIGILYISPLKALINDQQRRLQSLCDILDLPLTPWHGDVAKSIKNKQIKKPGGILLITPESLESLLLNKSAWCIHAFCGLNYMIVDEFHAFIGTERGCQLQSLMHRLEFLLQRTIPRIALSATLSEMHQVAHYLRPSKKLPCEIIESKTSWSDLKVQLRGYVNPAKLEDHRPPAFDMILNDLYTILRGKSHLVFANSRNLTESIAIALTDYCERDCVPNEFFPHHGNLSKEIRESLESRLQSQKVPTTAICTMTLELGIDIGNVDSIAQVNPPYSVASLRQRLGRSGRRGSPAILRMFISESEVASKTHLLNRLRTDVFQSIAMINLLVKKWYEPPAPNQYHFSTLVQQTLSVIGQYGGVRANQLWLLLCKTGPFHLLDQSLYGKFLKALGKRDLISQTQDGQIILGSSGEKLVGHYTFYTAFKTPDEYRLECEGKVLGTMPTDQLLAVGVLIVFAGHRWEILSVDIERKVISIKKAFGGSPYLFGESGQTIHDVIRQEMYRVYCENDLPVYLDKKAKKLFREGIDCFHTLKLDRTEIISHENTIHLLPWLGDNVINTLTIILRAEGLEANCYGCVIEIKECPRDALISAIKNILSRPKLTPEYLANIVPNTVIEKHDHLLPIEIRNLGYGARFFDVDGAYKWMERELRCLVLNRAKVWV